MIPQEVAQSVKIVTRAIKEDPAFYIAYQANIAMAFVDACSINRTVGLIVSQENTLVNKDYILMEDIHKLANVAAKRFLELWCRDIKNEQV